MIKCPPNQPVMYGFTTDYSKIDSPFKTLELVGINEVTFTSEEMGDDISAYKELVTLITQIAPENAKTKIAYSPAHYLVGQDLSSIVQYNEETGNVESIGGFKNPFEMINIGLYDSKDNQIGEGSVIMSKFEFFQSMDEMISDTIYLN